MGEVVLHTKDRAGRLSRTLLRPINFPVPAAQWKMLFLMVEPSSTGLWMTLKMLLNNRGTAMIRIGREAPRPTAGMRYFNSLLLYGCPAFARTQQTSGCD